jgi:hypothetical protein
MRPRESGPTNENQWVGPEAARPLPRRPAPRCHGVKAKTAPRATITPLVLPQTRSVAIHRRRRLLARLRWPGRRAGSYRRSRGITDSRNAVTPSRRRVLSLAGTKRDAPRRAPRIPGVPAGNPVRSILCGPRRVYPHRVCIGDRGSKTAHYAAVDPRSGRAAIPGAFLSPNGGNVPRATCPAPARDRI